jgi:hypothetical protein
METEINIAIHGTSTDLGYHFNPARMMMAIKNLSQTSFIKEN